MPRKLKASFGNRVGFTIPELPYVKKSRFPICNLTLTFICKTYRRDRVNKKNMVYDLVFFFTRRNRMRYRSKSSHSTWAYLSIFIPL